MQPQQKAKILGEITILEQVKHEHIMEIYNSWETPDGQYVVFITEIMSMTLKEYVIVVVVIHNSYVLCPLLINDEEAACLLTYIYLYALGNNNNNNIIDHTDI